MRVICKLGWGMIWWGIELDGWGLRPEGRQGCSFLTFMELGLSCGDAAQLLKVYALLTYPVLPVRREGVLVRSRGKMVSLTCLQV